MTFEDAIQTLKYLGLAAEAKKLGEFQDIDGNRRGWDGHAKRLGLKEVLWPRYSERIIPGRVIPGRYIPEL